MKNQETLNQDLYKAICALNYDNRIQLTQAALEAGGDANAIFNGFPLLHLATNYPNTDTIDLLLHYGANPESIDRNGKTASQRARQQNDSYGNNIANRIDQTTALLNAAKANNTDAVQHALDNGAYVNARDTNDLASPLHHAAFHGNQQMVHMLMNKGADIWLEDRMGNAPETKAANKGHNYTANRIEQTKYLYDAIGRNDLNDVNTAITNGASVSGSVEGLGTPLEYAQYVGNQSIVTAIQYARANSLPVPGIELEEEYSAIRLPKDPIIKEKPHVHRDQVIDKLDDREERWGHRKRVFNRVGNVFSSSTRERHMDNAKGLGKAIGKPLGTVVCTIAGGVGGAVGGAAIGSMIFPGVGTAIGFIAGGVIVGGAGYKIGGPVGEVITPHILQGAVWLTENTINLIPKVPAQIGRGISYLKEKSYEKTAYKVLDTFTTDIDLTEFVDDKRQEQHELKQTAHEYRAAKHQARSEAKQAKHDLKTANSFSINESDQIKAAKKAVESLIEAMKKKDHKAYDQMLRNYDPNQNWIDHICEQAKEFPGKTVPSKLLKAKNALNVLNNNYAGEMRPALDNALDPAMNAKKLRVLQHDYKDGSHVARHEKHQAKEAIAFIR